MTRVWISALTLLVFYACLQAFVLAPDGFVAGDQGTKLLQTRATLAHGPLTPWIDGLSQDLDTELQYQEPFLLRRDGSRHLIGVFPWILPTITAPLYWLFGLYGLYVVPAISIAVTFIAAHRLGRRLGTPGAGLSSAWSVVAATPVLFYGAEFWEHAPAVALTTSAVALAAPGHSLRRVARHVLAGASIGAAAAFRPEASVMLPALAIALLIAGLQPSALGLSSVAQAKRDVAQAFRPAISAILALVGGFGIVAALIVSANAAVYGSAIPQHVSSNLAFGWLHYRAMRAEIVRSLLLPASHETLFMAIVVAVAALALRRGTSTARVYGCHAIVVLLAFVAVGVPAWRWTMAGVPLFAAFTMTSAAHTWPFVFVGVYVLALSTSDVDRPVERYLQVVPVLFIAGAIAVMPHAGGTQWGPRFLLPAVPLLGIFASEGLGRFPVPAFQATSIRVMVAAVLTLSVIVQAFGLAVLAHDKTAHRRIGVVTEALTEPGDVIVSDLSWFPELTSRLCLSRRLLYARSGEDLTAIAARAAGRGFRRMTIVTSVRESPYRPPASLVLSDGVTFVQTKSYDIGVRSLRLYVYER